MLCRKLGNFKTKPSTCDCMNMNIQAMCYLYHQVAFENTCNFGKINVVSRWILWFMKVESGTPIRNSENNSAKISSRFFCASALPDHE